MSQFRAFYASRRFDQRSEFRSAADMGSYHVIAATKKKLSAGEERRRGRHPGRKR